MSLDNARKQLAACAAYQRFLGVSTSAAALARTYLEALPAAANGREYALAELVALRPFAIVSSAMFNGLTLRGDCVGGALDGGQIRIALEIAVPDEYRETPESTPIDMTVDLAAGALWINNLVGEIMAEFQALGASPAAGNLHVRGVRAIFGPCREPEQDTASLGPHFQALLAVEWGVE